MSNYILGISAFYHDSAAALLKDGQILAAAQEERFTRKKHDHSFPQKAIDYCLQEAGITADQLNHVIFYEKPFIKFNRILETYLSTAPLGLRSFLMAMPIWLGQKLWIPDLIRQKLNYQGPLHFAEHHESHAASAFFPSPFKRAAILTMDGVGEWTTSSIGLGHDNQIELLYEQHFPHSLGLLYSAFTYFTGFKVNSGEYKLMGLAPYGEPRYVQLILDELLDLKEDGSFKLNMKYFNYLSGLTMTGRKFARLFGGPPRQPEAPLTQREMDLAASIQQVTEEIVLRMAGHVKKVSGEKYLCLAGGVALNCVANGKLLRNGLFDDLWIQPAAGDAGGALGAALLVHYHLLNNKRVPQPGDAQLGSYLGPKYSNNEIEEFLRNNQATFEILKDDELFAEVARLLAEGKVVGWFQGRMEFGPRALGNRSILGDPRDAEMQKKMNLKIKFRESFRPFAPSVLQEKAGQWFQIDRPSPYMLLVAEVAPDKREPVPDETNLQGLDRLKVKRSQIPAVTHVDYTARLQTVSLQTNPRFYRLLQAFEAQTGCPVLINTSFNVRGEPIVASPQDAFRCFLRTEMDVLVMDNYLLRKEQQPVEQIETAQQEVFELD